MMLLQRFKSSLFLKNFSYLIAGNVTARAINMVTNVLLTRWLEPTGFGMYSLILTYISIFSAIASLGMQFITNKYVARNQEESRKYLYICLTIRIVGYVIAVIALLIYDYESLQLESFLLYALLLGIFCDSLWGGLQSIAFGMQRMQWNSIIDVSTAVLTLIIYLLMLFVNTDLISVKNVVWTYVLIYFIKNIVYWITLKKKGLVRGDATFESIKKSDYSRLLKEGLPFYILTLMGLFTNQFPIVFLEDNSGLEEVAYFNTANKLLLPLTILLSNALTSLFPNQSQLYVKDNSKFWLQARKMFGLIILTGSIMAFTVSVLRNEIVWLLYGSSYKNTGGVMAFQCWYIVLFAFFSLNGNVLGAADRQKLLMIESIVYAIITTPIIYLGSFKGAQGLSIAYVVASLINLIYLYCILHKISSWVFTFRAAIKNFSIIFIFSVLSFLIPSSCPIIIRLVVVAIILLFSFKIYVNKRTNATV